MIIDGKKYPFLSRAYDISSRIRNQMDKSMAQEHVASGLAENGMKDKARELFSEIERYSLKMKEQADHDGALYWLVISESFSGMYDLADSTARKIKDRKRRTQAEYEIVRAFAVAKSYDEAVRRAKKLDDPVLALDSLATIFIELSKSGKKEEAGKMIELAISMSSKIKEGHTRAQVLGSMMVDQIGAKLKGSVKKTYTKAMAAASTIRDPQEKAYAYHHIGDGASYGKLIKEARAAYKECAKAASGLDPKRKCETFCDLTVSQNARGMKKESAESCDLALEAAKKVKDRATKEDVLHLVAKKAAETGNIELAEEAIGMIRDDVGKLMALTHTARALAIKGSKKEARAMLKESEEIAVKIKKDRRSAAYMEIVWTCLESKMYDEAMAVSAKIQNPGARADGYANVAEFLFKAGKKERAKKVLKKALAVVPKIKKKDARGVMMLSIALTQADAGLFKEALATASRNTDAPTRCRSFSEIGAMLAKKNKRKLSEEAFEKSLAAVSKVKNQEMRDRQLYSCVLSLVDAGTKGKLFP